MAPRSTSGSSRRLARLARRAAVAGSLGIAGTLLAAAPSNAQPVPPQPPTTGTIVVGGVIVIPVPDIHTALDNWGWE